MSMISDETGREIVKALNRLAAAVEAKDVEARDADVARLRSAPRVPQWATGETCNHCGGGEGKHSLNCYRHPSYRSRA